MKRFLLILAFFVALVIGAIFMLALPSAERAFETHLSNLGYTHADVQKSNVKLTGLSFDKIHLNKDGFNAIEGMKVSLFWPSYLFSRKIDRIEIEKMILYITDRDIRKNIRRLTQTDHFISLPAHNISIQNIDISMNAGDTSLRLNGGLDITHDNSKHLLTGYLNASQYDLSFTSQWTGLINKHKEILEIDGNIEGLEIKSKALTVHRGLGWISYHANGADNILGGQFDAGSGRVFNLPANDISMTIGQNEEIYPIMFRSRLSGVEETYLNADFTYHTDVAKRDFQSVLSISNQQAFIDHLVFIDLIKTTSVLDTSSLAITLDYDSDKRFPSGPLPFSLSSNQNFKGTILFYPESYELRGTLQANDNEINLLKDIFEIGDDDINENVIRLDQNIQSLF